LSDPNSPWLAIVNPHAGRSRGHDWPSFERALRDAGVALDVELTTAPHDGERIAHAAMLARRHRLMVVGGDGSVHDVVNGIMGSGPLHTEATLAVAPLGTGNDWAKSLRVPTNPPAFAEMIAAGHTMQHDVGVIDFPEATPPRRRWFINVAGAGFDAYVIGQLPRRVRSTLAYLRGALRGLLRYRAPRFRIHVNGELIERRLLLAFIANAQACGNGMQVAPVARVDDGLLDLVTIDDVGFLRAVLKIAKLYRGTILGDPIVRHVRAETLRIEAEPPAEVEAEGQIAGQLPAVFTVLSGDFRVAVPAKGEIAPVLAYALPQPPVTKRDQLRLSLREY
jgi:diacylglycerol kinase (ATP)